MNHIKRPLIGSPKQTWDYYVSTSVELFLSNFRYEVPNMDIEKMVDIYTKEIPQLFEDTIFTGEHLEKIRKRLLEYLKNYINSRGGIENLDLYTEEELDIIFEQNVEYILNRLSRKLGVTREQLSQIFESKNEDS